MTERELRHLNRAELLELLLEESRENERLKEELARTKAELEERRLQLERSGSMAEATLRLNHVFEAADRAARQYLENIRVAARADVNSAGTQPGLAAWEDSRREEEPVPAATEFLRPEGEPDGEENIPGWASRIIRSEPPDMQEENEPVLFVPPGNEAAVPESAPDGEEDWSVRVEREPAVGAHRPKEEDWLTGAESELAGETPKTVPPESSLPETEDGINWATYKFAWEEKAPSRTEREPAKEENESE
ncbi:MAG: hypothetical protein ACI4OL_00050 [Gemmiger sp.]